MFIVFFKKKYGKEAYKPETMPCSLFQGNLTRRGSNTDTDQVWPVESNHVITKAWRG